MPLSRQAAACFAPDGGRKGNNSQDGSQEVAASAPPRPTAHSFGALHIGARRSHDEEVLTRSFSLPAPLLAHKQASVQGAAWQLQQSPGASGEAAGAQAALALSRLATPGGFSRVSDSSHAARGGTGNRAAIAAAPRTTSEADDNAADGRGTPTAAAAAAAVTATATAAAAMTAAAPDGELPDQESEEWEGEDSEGGEEEDDMWSSSSEYGSTDEEEENNSVSPADLLEFQAQAQQLLQQAQQRQAQWAAEAAAMAAGRTQTLAVAVAVGSCVPRAGVPSITLQHPSSPHAGGAAFMAPPQAAQHQQQSAMDQHQQQQGLQEAGVPCWRPEGPSMLGKRKSSRPDGLDGTGRPPRSD